MPGSFSGVSSEKYRAFDIACNGKRSPLPGTKGDGVIDFADLGKMPKQQLVDFCKALHDNGELAKKREVKIYINTLPSVWGQV
ncbi:hypothetical protein NO1_2076 [Candidatus Termititenax aidoneus]|uniref:Uncharacterized protein n=1 Tax=Termititenax aidoneus TaxID=2218524 RepID=A0A388TE34_TERA1|nr:hypothetical protein NO1_2076 [Candidatus Termititenax aidoneus]